MQIGILGAGNIGATLGRRLAEAGHTVLLGVRDPASAKAQAAAGRGMGLATLAEAAAFGEAVIVALPFDAALAELPGLPLAGKLLIDSTNAFGGLPAGYGSAAAAVAAAAPGARLVKAFNSGPWESIADPVYAGRAVETFICGEPAERAVAAELARAVGLIPVEVGGIESAALTESLAKLWGTLAFRAGLGRDIAFTLVRRGQEGGR